MITRWLAKIMVKIGRALFPEVYQAVSETQKIVNQYQVLIDKQTLGGKTLNVDEIAILGSLVNCHITVQPQVHPRIVLSETHFDAALGLSGDQAYLSNNVFSMKEAGGDAFVITAKKIAKKRGNNVKNY